MPWSSLRSAAAAVAVAVATAQITEVDIDWSNVTNTLQTVPAFQTVVNPLTTRQSPVHDQVYNSIAALGAQYQRYVPWLPYPKLGIAALGKLSARVSTRRLHLTLTLSSNETVSLRARIIDGESVSRAHPQAGRHHSNCYQTFVRFPFAEPPSTGKLCGFVNSGGAGNPWTTTIDCGGRGLGTISAVTFASYGTPVGYCGQQTRNPSCDAPGVASVVSAACVGKSSCTLTSNDETFGASPCSGTRLAVEVTCSGATADTVYTYWDFSWWVAAL